MRTLAPPVLDEHGVKELARDAALLQAFSQRGLPGFRFKFGESALEDGDARLKIIVFADRPVDTVAQRFDVAGGCERGLRFLEGLKLASQAANLFADFVAIALDRVQSGVNEGQTSF